MAVQVVRRSDEVVPCRENSNPDVFVGAVLRLWRLLLGGLLLLLFSQLLLPSLSCGVKRWPPGWRRGMGKALRLRCLAFIAKLWAWRAVNGGEAREGMWRAVMCPVLGLG
jgi:hypothetical protein